MWGDYKHLQASQAFEHSPGGSGFQAASLAGQVRFMVDGERIAADDTAEKLGLEEMGCILEVKHQSDSPGSKYSESNITLYNAHN